MTTITMDNLEIPTCGLKESIHNLEILYHTTAGEECPRCGGKYFGKLGTYSYKGKTVPRILCRDCGYAFSTVDFEKDGSTHNRAARIFNLDNKKADNLIEDSIRFGLIAQNDNGTYSAIASKNISKLEVYHKVPLYHYLIETVGNNLKRRIFEDALKSHPDKTLAPISKIKRDTLWRRYQEIAVEIFVCEKTCKFSRTCKKSTPERNECDVVKKTKKPSWRVDVEL